MSLPHGAVGWSAVCERGVSFLMVLWVGLQSVNVAFPDHTHFFILSLFFSFWKMMGDILILKFCM